MWKRGSALSCLPIVASTSLLLVIACGVQAQKSGETPKELQRARNLARQGRWEEALRIVDQVLEQRGSIAAQVRDSFDAKDLSDIWIDLRFAPGAVDIQSKVTRSGMGAARITLQPGDLAQPGGPDSFPAERAELMESPFVWALEDRDYTYSFSLFLPRSFPIVPTRLVIAQWKQICRKSPCEPDNPVLSIRYIAGELLIKQYIGPTSTTLYRRTEDVRGKWLDFKFKIRFSQQPYGYVRGWLNGERIVDYRGVTAYRAQGGYPDKNRFYFKANWVT